LIEGMMLDSGNDAAEALAMSIVDRAAFITFMNQKAAALHLRATHFTNPSGLDEADHYSSAYDLAVTGATLLADYPDLRAIVGSKQISDRKSTRLNSSHDQISYAVFCLKKKTNKQTR